MHLCLEDSSPFSPRAKMHIDFVYCMVAPSYYTERTWPLTRTIWFTPPSKPVLVVASWRTYWAIHTYMSCIGQPYEPYELVAALGRYYHGRTCMGCNCAIVDPRAHTGTASRWLYAVAGLPFLPRVLGLPRNRNSPPGSTEGSW